MAELEFGPGFEVGGGERITAVQLATDPAAGAEVSITIPGRATWQLVALSVDLVTDATAATRIPSLVLEGEGRELAKVPSGLSQAASLTRTHTWAPGLEGSVIPAGASAGVTGFLAAGLPAGFVLRTETDVIAAGDNYGRALLLVVETPRRGVEAQVDYVAEWFHRLAVEATDPGELRGPALEMVVRRLLGLLPRG